MIINPYVFAAVEEEPDVGLFIEEDSSPEFDGDYEADFTLPSPTGDYLLEDTFAGDGALVGRATESGGATWNESGAVNETSGGIMTLEGSSGAQATAFVTGQELNFPAGIFVEAKFNSANLASVLGISFNVGSTGIAIYLNDNSYDFEPRVRMDISGLNGFVTEAGGLLPANEEDTTGLVSASYSLNRFYSEIVDARNQTVRAECDGSEMRMYIGGALVLQKPMNFTTQFVATAGDPLLYPDVWVTLLKSGAGDNLELDYIRGGSLA
jgi:hypothetical protein